MGRYKDWEVLDHMPLGWREDKTAGSPLKSSIFITNGESLISGRQKRAILMVKPKLPILEPSQNRLCKKEENRKVEDPYSFPARNVQELARCKFKEQILKEILFDITVCEIEGWDKKEYINELKELLNEIEI